MEYQHCYRKQCSPSCKSCLQPGTIHTIEWECHVKTIVLTVKPLQYEQCPWCDSCKYYQPPHQNIEQTHYNSSLSGYGDKFLKLSRYLQTSKSSLWIISSKILSCCSAAWSARRSSKSSAVQTNSSVSIIRRSRGTAEHVQQARPCDAARHA